MRSTCVRLQSSRRKISSRPTPGLHSRPVSAWAGQRSTQREQLPHRLSSTGASASSGASVFYISGGEGQVTPVNKLRPALDSTRFEADKGLDVGKIAHVLEEASLS